MYIMTGKKKDFEKRDKHASCFEIELLKCLYTTTFYCIFTQSVNKHDNIYHDVNKLK